jgi:hypothetical protein
VLVLASAALAAFAAWYLDRRPRAGAAVTAALIFLPCLAMLIPFFVSPSFPQGDSWLFHFPSFEHVARSLDEFRAFPRWYPTSGGIRAGYFHVNAPIFHPHRLVGYLIYCLLPLSAGFVYKLQYVLGIFLMAGGWFLVLKKCVGSAPAAFSGTLMIVLGGTGITVHQEQVVFTTVLMPWFLLSLLGLRDSPRFLFPAAILFGLGLSTHYPQIQAISMGAAALLLALLHPACVRACLPFLRRRWPALLLLIVLGALPSLYLGINLPRLASELRQSSAAVAPRTYPEYLALSRAGGACSAPLFYLLQYLDPRFEKASGRALPGDARDPCSFFVGRLGLFLAALGLVLKFRRSWPAALLALFFASLSLGVNSPLPFARLLFALRFPSISVFRQWLHFFPLLNFCLAYLAALGVVAVRERRPRRPELAAALLIFFQAAELGWYDQIYFDRFLTTTPPPKMADGFFAREDVGFSGLFQYRDRFRLARACPEKAIPSAAFLTVRVSGADPSDPPSIDAICRVLSAESAPAAVLWGEESFSVSEEADFLAAASEVTPAGLGVEVSSPRPALLVSPMNYGLGVAGFIDGEAAAVRQVNGAFCGMIVPPGRHRARFLVRRDAYDLLLLSQWALYALAAVLLVRELRRAP